MGRHKTDRLPGHGKILDAWVPPEGAGEPVGCAATSFTFGAAFFEEECLARFVQMSTEPNSDGILYLVDREEKLSKLTCAAALVDQHHCRGLRSLRWDLLPCRPPRGILHAKVALVHWTECVRVIVTSANLTESGYRRNHEIYGVLDYRPDGKAPLRCLREIGAFLQELARLGGADGDMNSPALGRWMGFVEGALKAARQWGVTEGQDSRAAVRVSPVLVGGGRPSALESLTRIWPGNSPPTDAYVVSPFFDPPGRPNRPAEELWAILRRRGVAEVHFYVEADDGETEGGAQIHAPASLRDAAPENRVEVDTSFYRIALEEGRPLHAKTMWLEDERRVVYMVGSSNFTSAGLGLRQPKNYEANLAYVVDGVRSPGAHRNLEEAFPDGELLYLAGDERWEAVPVTDEDMAGTEPALPPGFGVAVYGVDAQQHGHVELTIVGELPKEWGLQTEDETEILLDEGQWVGRGRPAALSLSWERARPPSGFWVTWDGAPGPAWWPVNIRDTGSLAPPDELKELTLDDLVGILTSARPLHEALRRCLRRGAVGNGGERASEVDPHKWANRESAKFLLQRTRRVSYALTALRERLERPVATENSLEWRLRGPVGVMAVADAVVREARSVQEQGFLLAELALELARAKPKTAPGHLPRRRVSERIQGLIPELRRRIPKTALTNSGNIRKYIQHVFSVIDP